MTLSPLWQPQSLICPPFPPMTETAQSFMATLTRVTRNMRTFQTYSWNKCDIKECKYTVLLTNNEHENPFTRSIRLYIMHKCYTCTIECQSMCMSGGLGPLSTIRVSHKTSLGFGRSRTLHYQCKGNRFGSKGTHILIKKWMQSLNAL